jgi:hypothetical protein
MPLIIKSNEIEHVGRGRRHARTSASQAHGTYSALDPQAIVRCYFNIRDQSAIQDPVGREFGLVSQAVVYVKYLAADHRCLETHVRPQFSIQVIREDARHIHEETVFP